MGGTKDHSFELKKKRTKKTLLMFAVQLGNLVQTKEIRIIVSENPFPIYLQRNYVKRLTFLRLFQQLPDGVLGYSF